MWIRRVQVANPGRPWGLYVLVGLLLCGVGAASAAVGFVDALVQRYSMGLPPVERLLHHKSALTTTIYSSDGKLIATLFRQNRVFVPLPRIPLVLQHAVLASEDARFYQHHGVDPVGIVRSVVVDALGGHATQGASTLTMQLARSIFLSPEQSIERKIREALLAVQIEKHFSKDEILEFYLNQIYLGSGAYGVEAASEAYFGKRVEKLTLAEAAMIAGLPPAPTLYSPHVSFEAARVRQILVLGRMVQCGYITGSQMQQAIHQRLHIQPPQRLASVLKFPYFTSYVIRQLSQQFSPDELYSGGLRVYTTLDTRMQRIAQQAVNDGVTHAEKSGYNVHQGALVALQPSNGFVRAMVGGRAWSVRDQFNRAWQAVRQPGSTFKIFVYSTALEFGFSPDSILIDAPQTFQVVKGQYYTPKNSDGRFWGPMPIWRALQYSRDVPALRIANTLGVLNVIRTANRMGILEHIDPDLPVALGSTAVTPLELASAVSTLPNLGVHVTPTVIKDVKDAEGHVLLDYRTPQAERAITEQTAMAMVGMLQKVIEAGTGTEAQIGRAGRGKTGTTDSHRDAWFVGFTPDLLATVWTGNDDYSVTSGAYGGTVAAPIWADFMKQALAKVPPHDFGVIKNGKVGILMCDDTNERAGSGCPHVHRVFFSPDKIPEVYCTQHSLRAVGPGFAFVNLYRFALGPYGRWYPDLSDFQWSFPKNYVAWNLPPTVIRHSLRGIKPVALQPPVSTSTSAPPVVTPRARPVAVVPYEHHHSDRILPFRVMHTPIFTIRPPALVVGQPPAPPVVALPPPPPPPAAPPRVRYTPRPTPEETPRIFQRSREEEDMDFEHP